MKKLIILAALFFSVFSLAENLPTEHTDKAKDLARPAKEKLGSATTIKQNAIAPLTSDAKMKTFDGSKEFNSSFMCNSATTFADLTVSILGNGNARVVNLRQDTDLNGSIDSYQTPNWEASAICANGFMRCSNPGDPTTCQSYKWAATGANYQVSPVAVPLSDLGGCYCVNNACGQSLAINNLKKVVTDIGTGISAALAGKNNYFALTELKVDGGFAELKGVNTSCGAASASDVIGNENIAAITNSDYVNNPSRLTDDGFSAQGQNPLYSKVASTAQDTGFEYRQCTINRSVVEDEVSTQDIIAFDSGTGSLYEVGNNKMRIVLGKIGDDYLHGNCSYSTMESNFFVKRPERIIRASIKRAVFDDWIQVHVIQDGQFTHVWNAPYGNWTSPTANVPGNCELNTSWDMDNINVNFASAFSREGQVKFRTRIEVSGDGEGYVLGELELDTSCRIKPDEFANTCALYEQNDKCTLVSEDVDGVSTFSNGFSTGLYPLPAQVGEFCGVNQTRDWMKKTRQYRCESDYAYDFSAGFERMEHVKTNSTLESWSDKPTNYDTGESSEETGSFKKWDGLGAKECSMTCKTRLEKPMNEVALSGNIGANHNNPTSYDFFYHQCTGDDSNVCPAGAGEEIIKACQCINEFSEATAIMQALRLAGQDMICSDGTKQNPDGGSNE